MIRKIIRIDEEKCNGCGLCAEACHEGAIGMVDGKAKLLREDYCDGLGNCLPVCPTGAISFMEKETLPFQMPPGMTQAPQAASPAPTGGCPGQRMKTLARSPKAEEEGPDESGGRESCLSQWPVQIKLVPINAPYFNGADVLIAADCTAFAHGDFHRRFIRGKVALIGCPKLDEGDYSEKLTEIFRQNDIRSVTVVRMEVPCCGGMERAVQTAWNNAGKKFPWKRVVIGLNGDIIDTKEGETQW